MTRDDRSDYIDALEAADDGDLTPLVALRRSCTGVQYYRPCRREVCPSALTKTPRKEKRSPTTCDPFPASLPAQGTRRTIPAVCLPGSRSHARETAITEPVGIAMKLVAGLTVFATALLEACFSEHPYCPRSFLARPVPKCGPHSECRDCQSPTGWATLLITQHGLNML